MVARAGGSAPPVELIAAVFGLGNPVGPAVYAARGELGHVWRLSTDRGTWAVKSLIGPVEPTTGEDARFQLAVLAHGSPIPRPVLTAEGAAVSIGPDGGTAYRVYEWVDVDPDVPVDPTTAGALLAQVHGLAWPVTNVDPWFHRPVPDDTWPKLVAEAHRQGAPWAAPLEQRVDEILATTTAIDPDPPARIVRCHLDYNPDNILVDRAGRAWVIDWENSGGGDPVQEVMQSLDAFAGNDSRAAQAFLAGYIDAGGTIDALGLGAFSMAFAVQANLLALYARRALDGHEDDRARATWRLETMLPALLTVERAHDLLRLVRDAPVGADDDYSAPRQPR